MSNNSNLPSGGTGTADDISDAALDDFLDEDTGDGATENGSEGDEDVEAKATDADESDADEADGEGDEAEGEEGGKPDPIVKLDDGTEVKLSELVAGNMRQADYTRKTQELAHARQEFDATLARFSEHARQRETQLEQAFEDVVAVMADIMPREPDVSLSYTDPVLYNQQRAVYDAALRRIQGVIGSQKQARDKLASVNAQHEEQRLNLEMKKVVQAFPIAGDPVKGQKFWEAALDMGRTLGFSDQELAQADSRQVIALAKLAQYEARAKGGKAAEAASVTARLQAKAARPGVITRKPAPNGASSKALRSFRETGSVTAAERAWAEMDIN